MKFRLSAHAQRECKGRRLPADVLESVLQAPQQIVDAHGGLRAYQSQIQWPHGKMYLVRAIVAEDTDPPVVVTAYRTSKIAKYWREP